MRATILLSAILIADALGGTIDAEAARFIISAWLVVAFMDICEFANGLDS